MENLSCFNSHSGTSTISIHVICVVPFCAELGDRVSRHNQASSNHTVVAKYSPQKSPKKIMKKISKAIIPYMCIKTKLQKDDKCLWKKPILMGEKCQPLEFSGAIFYDSDGNQLSEPPKSPGLVLSSSQSLSQKRGEIDM